MKLRSRRSFAVFFLCLCGMIAGRTFAASTRVVPPKQIRVTLLGTASGPRVHAGKAGISTLVEAGGERFLFDAGRGCMQRLVEAGFPMNAVTKLFLTHLHSDHVLDVPDLMLTPWSSAPERKVPLEIWGPQGTRDMSNDPEAWQRLFDADPTDEDAARNLMKILAQRGDVAGATRVYRRLVDTLRRQLDVEPERETTALVERLKKSM